MKKILLGSLLLMTTACGPGLDYAVQPGGIRVEDKNGDLAGYWVNDVSGPLLYLPDLLIYVPIYLETGKYRNPDLTGFDSAACAGNPLTNGHPIGTTYALPNGKYYKVTDKKAPAATTAASVLQSNGTCAGTVPTYDPSSSMDVVEETTQPRDFTSLAPLTLILPQ